MNDLLGIVGSVSSPSNTRSAVSLALKAAENEFGVTTKLLHLAEYKLDTADGRKLNEYEGDTLKALDLIINSKAFIIGTPVYRGSYSGVLKNLFDLIPRGKWQSDKAPLENRAVGLVATGATAHHYLTIAQELGPILNFFGAYLVGSGVYAESDHFKDYEVNDPAIQLRLENLGKATAELSLAVEKSKFLSELGPQF